VVGRLTKNLLSVQLYWSYLRTIYEGVSTMLQIMTSALGRVLKDREGVSAVEYALLLVGIAAAVGAVVWTLGGDVSSAFGTVVGKFTAPTS
jgi:Flp pilus assembly pilin Flp